MVDLRLQDNNFVSTLPTQWSSLTSLQTLNLSNNTIITGTLPSSWSTMTAMRNMNLSGLNLEGQIPSSWSSMTQMRELIAPNMQLDGPLPISTFQSWPLLNSSPSTSTIHNNCMYTGLITSPQTTWLNTFWSRATQKKCSADLQITLTSKSATDYDPGKTITYTINYANNGARWSYEPVVNITLNT